MKKENQLRKNLLLVDYFLYEWSKSDNPKKVNGFLFSISQQLFQRVLYLLCVESVSEDSAGLFSSFKGWKAFPNGTTCYDVFTNRAILYNFELREVKISNCAPHYFWQSRPAPAQYMNIFYPIIASEGVNCQEDFKKYLENEMPRETELIRSSLRELRANKDLWTLVRARADDALSKIINDDLFLWKYSMETDLSELPIKTHKHLLNEKRMFNQRFLPF